MPENNQVPVNPNPIFNIPSPRASIAEEIRIMAQEALERIELSNESNTKKEKKKLSYEDRLNNSIPKGWRLIKRGELLFYPCMALNDNYEPERGWRKINVLGVDKLNKPYHSLWGYYIIPNKKKK